MDWWLKPVKAGKSRLKPLKAGGLDFTNKNRLLGVSKFKVKVIYIIFRESNIMIEMVNDIYCIFLKIVLNYFVPNFKNYNIYLTNNFNYMRC